ncbi:MAG TPA: DUF2905 domain-containing protein [Syntrophomonadaceae bacterium]|jgi:hypothetical protein|nr:DUF2905 domain-containing protein [Syntrophomonadaceae bacterium]HRX21549.1 DUF2905 domain-containing protein [Syntrophomonadaceae bacterium]
MQYSGLAKIVIALGILLIIVGAVMLLFSKYGFHGFRLPGDILIQKENFTFYFPVTTAIIISILLTVLFNFISRR